MGECLGDGCVAVDTQLSLGVIPGSCCSGKLAVFTVLCEQYQPSLRRDPMYNEVRLLHLAVAPHPGQQPGGGNRQLQLGRQLSTMLTC